MRLRQGDFAREDVYSTDAAAVARAFAGAGAEWIHVVDLDGALQGERRQGSVIAAIREALDEPGSPHPGPRLQIAGGLRTMEAVDAVVALGADRVVIGTAALTEPEVVAGAIDRHGPDRLAVALDVRDGRAVGHGWVPGTPGTPLDTVVARLTSLGVTTFVVTAIERDGLLGGPDLGLLRRVVAHTDAAVIASGGIASIGDVRAVHDIGCAGVVVGRALYDGTLDLATILAAVAARP